MESRPFLKIRHRHEVECPNITQPNSINGSTRIDAVQSSVRAADFGKLAPSSTSRPGPGWRATLAHLGATSIATSSTATSTRQLCPLPAPDLHARPPPEIIPRRMLIMPSQSHQDHGLQSPSMTSSIHGSNLGALGECHLHT